MIAARTESYNIWPESTIKGRGSGQSWCHVLAAAAVVVAVAARIVKLGRDGTLTCINSQ